MIKVLIVDDHAIVRQGLCSALSMDNDIKVVGQANDGREAIEQAIKLVPDIITMDVLMPQCSGLEALITIRDRLPNTKILMLTISDREQDLVDSLRFGAQGYLLKSATIDEVMQAIHRTMLGEAILSPQMATRLIKEFQTKTIVSMNSIMVDGTGMCGGCRVRVGGVMKFACVDGPDFDGHLVDFDEAMSRMNAYSAQEAALDQHVCHLLSKVSHE